MARFVKGTDPAFKNEFGKFLQITRICLERQIRITFFSVKIGKEALYKIGEFFLLHM